MNTIHKAMYDRFEEMTVDNGYYYDWETVQSKGNGSLALKKPTTTATAKGNISFGLAESLLVVSGGRTLVQMPMIVTANAPATFGLLEKQDVQAEDVRRKLLSDLRHGFRFVTAGMCTAGVQLLGDMAEESPEVADGSTVIHVRVVFQIQYFE